jgi:hypothetical protein
MGIKSMVRLPRRWLDAAGIALVTGLAVAGAYVEANPVHRYGGLHLASHPPLAAYLLLAVPSVALIWRNSRPVEVLGLAVGGAVGWAALGQIDGAALVPVIVGVYCGKTADTCMWTWSTTAGPRPRPSATGPGRDWPECESGPPLWEAPWMPGRVPAAGSPSTPGCRWQQPQPEDQRPSP